MSAASHSIWRNCFSRLADPSEDPATAVTMLRLAESLPELRRDTHLWQAVHAQRESRPWEAWAYLISMEIGPLLANGRLQKLPQFLAAAARAQGAETVARHLLTLYPADPPNTLSQQRSNVIAALYPEASELAASPSARRLEATVDIIIPVYRGHGQTLECLDSVFASQALLRTKTEIVVINDASPEEELVAELRNLASQQRITLIEQPENLGFIRTMNRAMALHPARDVVWLNADTRVTGNWLDRLKRVANTDPAIAGVSPLSNHGELTSFPYPRRQGRFPSASDQQQLDTLAQKAWNGEIPPLEAVCGFCLYLRRSALDQVGFLDETELISGYGEDTDWSLRALALGWQLVVAPNVFVAHHGSVSFGSQKRQLVAHNNKVLKKRYPTAERAFDSYLQQDPLAQHRQRLQRERLGAIIGRRGRGKSRPNGNKTTPAVSGELLILGPCSWNHPALAHSLLDPYAADGSIVEPPPIDHHPWLRWRPLANSLKPEACEISLSLPPAGQSLPILLKYQLPEDASVLEQDLSSLPDLVWVFHELERCPIALLNLRQQLGRKARLYPIDDALLTAAAYAGAAPESATQALKSAPRKTAQTAVQKAAPKATQKTTLSTAHPARAQQLLSLAQDAEVIVLPYHSLLERYRLAIPDASIEIQSPNRRPEADEKGAKNAQDTQDTQDTKTKNLIPGGSLQVLATRSLLIADDLNHPVIIRKWLEFARALSQAQNQNKSQAQNQGQAQGQSKTQPGEPPIKLLVLTRYPCNLDLRSIGNLIEIAPIAGVSLPDSLQLCHCTAALSLDADPGAGWRAPGLAAQVGLPLLAPASTLAREAGASTFGSLAELTHRVLKNNLSAKAVTMTKKRAHATSSPPPWQAGDNQKVFLNLGSGNGDPAGLPRMFQGEQWQQVRIDIDPDMKPDIVTSSADLSMIPNGQIDAIWSSHSLEHLDFHDVPGALQQMQRVLKPDGFALVTLPDIAAVAELVVAGRLNEVIYQSAAGPIRAMDMLFGHGASVAAGKRYMAHRCGFDAKLLGESLLDAGFHEVRVRKGSAWDLWAFALNSETPPSVFELEV